MTVRYKGFKVEVKCLSYIQSLQGILKDIEKKISKCTLGYFKKNLNLEIQKALETKRSSK